MSYQKLGARRTPEQEIARRARANKPCKKCGKRESEHPGGAFCKLEEPVQKPPRKTAKDLMYDMAKRAKELADMKMPVLRIAAEYEGLDLGDGSRGSMIEAVLCEEFESQAESADDA